MTQTNFALLASVSFIAISPSFAFAKEATAPLSLVITPTRSATPINQIASSMTVITAEQIAQKNKPTVAELLRDVPGITIANNGGPGQTARVFMRGTNSNHVLVLIDGVVANDPSDPGNAFDFANLTTDNISQIEVLRGAQSTLYGSDAIGGVINIITKTGKGAPSVSGFAEYGRYNTSRGGVSSSGEIGSTNYSFSASNFHTNGISAISPRNGGFEKDGNNTYTIAANINSQLTDNFLAKVNARYNRVVTQFDSPGSFNRPLDDVDPNNDSRQFNGRVAGELSLYEGKWTQELGVSLLNLNRNQITVYYDNAFNELFGRQQQLGKREMVDWVHHIKILPDHLLTAGLEARSDHFETQQLKEVNVDNKAVFADDQFTIGKSFFMNVGVRQDFHQAFGDQFTYKIAPGYRIAATGTTLKATYGTGFKAPSLSQLYDSSYGNAALNPEKSKGWDAGFEQKLFGDVLTFGATAFRNDIRQLIGNNPAPPYASINTGKARTSGVENTFTLHPSADWTMDGSYTYTLSQDRTKSLDLLRRPRHQISAGANYQYSTQGDVGLRGRYLSSRRDFDINFPYGRLYVKSFTTLDLTTNYKITPDVTVYGRIDNLLDKRYQEVFAYGQPGMSLFAGVKTNF